MIKAGENHSRPFIGSDQSSQVSRRRLLAAAGAAGLLGGVSGRLASGDLNVAMAAEGKYPYLDARDFSGIDPTGKSECGKAFEEAMSQAIAARLKLYLPAGDYVLKGVVLQSGLYLFGDPGFTSRLLFPMDEVGSIMGTGLAGKSANDVVFEDICWDGQQQLRKISMGNALIKAYNARRWTLRRCKVINGTSYGFGWQGMPNSPDPEKRGPQTDLLMDECYFHDNGYLGGTVGIPHSGTPNSMDNIDIKSSERVLMNRVYSTGSSDKGINVRGRYAIFVGCVAENNVVGMDFNVTEQNKESEIRSDSHFMVVGGAARGNKASGLAFTCGSSGVVNHGDVLGFHSNGNLHGLRTNSPAAGSAIHLNVHGGHYNDNSGHGIWMVGASTFNCSGVTALRNKVHGIFLEKAPGGNISNCTVKQNEGDAGIRCHESGGGAIHGNVVNENVRGIYVTAHDGGAIIGNTCSKNTNQGIIAASTSDRVSAAHNTLVGNAVPIAMVGAKSIACPNITDTTVVPTVSSTSELSLPTIADLITVTGSAEITKIIPGQVGRRVTLLFNGSLTMKDGNNLLLAGNLNTTSATVISLVCDGVNWRETGRTNL